MSERESELVKFEKVRQKKKKQLDLEKTFEKLLSRRSQLVSLAVEQQELHLKSKLQIGD